METGETLDAVIERDVRGVVVAPAPPDVATTDREEADQCARERGGPRKNGRGRRFGIFGVLRRLWMPLLILVVFAGGGFTVARLHSVFGSENRPLYADSKINDTKPFNPKRMTYEIFGPPGTVASISYFDVNADPKRVEKALLPWSVEFASTEATAVGSVVAQGDSGSIGCRILVDGEVKAERISNEVNAFTFCVLKAA